MSEHVVIMGRPSCLVFGTKDHNGQPSQAFRTLFIQELLRRGVLGQSLVISAAHTDADIDQTIDAAVGALEVYARAVEARQHRWSARRTTGRARDARVRRAAPTAASRRDHEREGRHEGRLVLRRPRHADAIRGRRAAAEADDADWHEAGAVAHHALLRTFRA